ncbi:hypothetical protein [Halobacteriaceae bacterium SHR40]|uniref:hypothetical protein n=1 Tax=Halovenus amylolytica TaxID=2500550 RepID=UPI000FE3CB42
MSDDRVTLSVAELADYCGTQARFLAGRSETIGRETDELLDEIDEDIAEIRERLTTYSAGPDASAASPPTPNNTETDEVTQLDDLETALEEKQAVAEAKRERMAAFQELSEAYAELAVELTESADDGQEALERVVQFEQRHDAPAYFDDQQTLLEIVADSKR